MSGKTWVAADHHFGHPNILRFMDSNGVKIRGSRFADTDEHDEYLIKVHNERVHPQDRVYLLGDVCISRRNIHKMGRLNGRIVLVKGNHDIFKLSDYTPYVDDVRACVVKKDHDGNKVILSHIPIHPDSLGRWGTNIHGHYHQNKLDDPRYICVSLEHTNYFPIEFQEALKLRGLRQ